MPITRARAWRWAAIAAPVALAAALLVTFLPRQGGPDVAPVPAYELVTGSGEQALRGGAAPTGELPIFRRGTVLELVARPAQDVAGPVVASTFVVGPYGAGVWPTVAEVAPTGAVRVRGRIVDALDLAPGDWEVRVFVGRPEVLPRTAEELPREGVTAGDGWQMLSLELRVAPSE